MSDGTSSYDDLTDPAAAGTREDCRATTKRLDEALRRMAKPAPSLHFDEQPREARKPQIEISDAAARLSAAIYGH
jgi:hypothetical protein